MLAVKAIATRYREWRNHVVAYFEGFHRRSDFVHVSSEFVAHDEVCAGRLMTSVDMEFTDWY
jgi:hypothetical protein